MAGLLSEQDRHAAAIELLQPLAKISREARRLLADELTADGRLDDVEQLWRGLDDAEARLALATVLEARGRKNDALALLQQAVGDGITEATERLALLLRRLGDESRLENFWRDMGRSGFGQLASLWLARGHADKAEKILIAAVDADDDETEDARVQLANLYLSTESLDQAEQILRAGVHAGESSSRLRLVALLSDSEREDEADELLRKAPPDDFKARRELITRLLARRAGGEAEKYSRIALINGDPDARSWLCDALVAQGRKPEAMKEWEHAIAAGEQSAWYQEAEWLLGDHGDINEAERMLAINEAKRVLAEAMAAGVGDERIRERLDQLAAGLGSTTAPKGLKPPMRDTCL